MTGVMMRFIRDTFGDGRVYLSYNDLMNTFDHLLTDPQLSESVLTTRDRLVYKETIKALKLSIQDTRDRSGI